MDIRLLQSINHEIYRRFPDLEGAAPRVQTYRASQSRALRPRFGARLAGIFGLGAEGAPSGSAAAYQLVYQGRRTTATGRNMPYVVRVVVAENGKILKTTMSH